MVRLIASAAALTMVAGVATAGMDPLPWLSFSVVDNGGGSDGFVNLAGTTTYDLYWNNMGTETALVNAFNLSSAAQPDLAPYRIYHTGTAVNHGLGDAAGGPPNPALLPSFPLLAFDSYFAVGDATVSFVPGSAAFLPGEVLGTWFTLPPVAVAAGESLRFMRLTINGEIDVENSIMEVGFSDGERVFVFVPTPGAAALLGLGGLVTLRRRR